MALRKEGISHPRWLVSIYTVNLAKVFFSKKLGRIFPKLLSDMSNSFPIFVADIGCQEGMSGSSSVSCASLGLW